MKRLLRTAPVIVLAAVFLALAAGSAGTLTSNGTATAAGVGDCVPGSDWGTVRADLAASVVSLVNAHRTSLGRVALKVSPTLTNAAVWKARHMARYSYMQHDDPAPPIARTVSQRLAACGYPSTTSGWGENIAYGYASASAVVNAWLNSSGHRANIENSTYRSTGVGAASNASGVLYWSQEFGTYDDSGTGGGGSTGAPTVSLTSGPPSTTTSTSASFAWTTGGTVSSTTCSLDGAAATACASPKSYSGLAVGTHTFRVTVSNSGGSASAAAGWTVSSTTPPPPPTGTAPTVRFSSAPYFVQGSTATFAWSTTGTVSSTTCSLDGRTPAACASPYTLWGLTRGSHRLTVAVSGPGGAASTTAGFWVF